MAQTAGNSAECRIGFVGTGGVAARHAQILREFSDVRLIAGTDVDPMRANAFAAAHDLVAVPDVEALLAADLDAVYVCVPPFAHGPLEDVLLAAGLPLFIEKPLAVDLPTAERIGADVARRGTITRVGLHWRLGEPAQRAKRLLADRTVRLVHATWWDVLPPVPWWIDPALSGGQVVEQAVHVLDLARALVGEVTQVGATEAAARADRVAAASAALLRFEEGALGTLTTSCSLEWTAAAGLCIVTDDLVVDVRADGVRTAGAEGDHHWPADPQAAKVATDRAFVDAVLGAGADPATDGLPDYAEALRSHRLACAVAKAVATGATERP
jgi:myo-inositol 2-dehydrogenase / D-chiro-inositol 1-dehydrogenase